MVIALVGIQAVAGAPAAYAQSCGEAPNPERPGTGMVGALDAMSSQAQGEANSPYRKYGYAGMVWHVYETDCGPMSGITNPNTTIDTWLGNQLFNVAKNIVGATNALHYTVMEGGLFAPIYDAIAKGTDVVYNNIYAQLFGLVALLLAIMMFRHIWRGDLPSVSKRALFALAAIWLAASSFALLRYVDTIDRAIVETTSKIQAGFVDEDEQRGVRHILPTNLHNEIVYNNWLRGLFGSPDSAEAEEHGRDLLDAQAFSWDEMAAGDDGDQAVIDGKNAEYKRIAEDLGTAQGYFTGEDGSRTGAGFIAFLQSLVYSLFQLIAKAAVLLAQVLIRLLALTAPLIGLAALLHHDLLRKVARVAGTVMFNLVILSVLAGVHALLLNAIFAASGTLSMLTQIAMAGFVTILMFVVGRPVRRLWQMIEVSTKTVGAALPAAPSGIFSRFRRHQERNSPQNSFWQNVRDTDMEAPQDQPGALGTATMAGRRARPEARNPVTATAHRLGEPGTQRVAPAANNGAAALPTVPGRAELPPGGTPNPARLGFTPAGGLDSGASYQQSSYQQSPRRRTDVTAPPTPARLYAPYRADPSGREFADAVVVPSRMAGQSQPTGVADGRTDFEQPARNWQQASATPPTPQRPRLADAEVVGGRPVYMVYRPSRGLEVRQPDARDTDAAVR